MICRSCSGRSFGQVLDLGSLPLVNNLESAAEDESRRWPLEVVFCRTCSLVQLTEAPPPEAMFDEYCYFSSLSETMVRHAKSLVSEHVRPGHRVLEIASNDGYLLSAARAAGADVLGVDPARNIARHARRRGIPTECAYFDREVAERLLDEWGRADVIFANNVLAHVPDPNEIVAGIATILAEDGVAHVEVPYVVNMVRGSMFDTIYHEHQCYFSVTALRTLFERHGLQLDRVEVVDIHGGSLHVTARRESLHPDTGFWCERERSLGIFDDAYYADFAAEVRRIGAELEGVIESFDWVAGYGAAAKGVVMLNVFGLGPDRIQWIADVSPHKQGRYVPGTGQAIVSPATLVELKPPACVIFPWNIKDEIIRRNRPYTDLGGRFIVPIPEVTVA